MELYEMRFGQCAEMKVSSNIGLVVKTYLAAGVVKVGGIPALDVHH
jgi:hypothetical protein